MMFTGIIIIIIMCRNGNIIIIIMCRIGIVGNMRKTCTQSARTQPA